MNQISNISLQSKLHSIFLTNKTFPDVIMISELLKFCKTRKIIPVMSNKDLMSVQDLNMILFRINSAQGIIKTQLSFQEFESVFKEIAEIGFKNSAAGERLPMLIRFVGKNGKVVSNFDLDLENLAEKSGISLRNGHKHTLSQRTIIKKTGVKGKITLEKTHRTSKSSLNGTNTESILKTLKTCEKSACSSNIHTGKHTRASSLDKNLEVLLENLRRPQKTIRTKLEHAKTLITKLKNSQFKHKKPVNTCSKYMNFMKNREKKMFSNAFLMQLLFKSWANYVKSRRKLRKRCD